MNSYNNILDKLTRFIKKYYTITLVKGVLFFIGFALFAFLIITAVEYFLWLSSTWRLVLLLVFLGGTLFLLYKFIAIPLFYLFRLKNGITNKQASVLIGKHFPEVGDKLFNLLDLAEDSNSSELLVASIAQRSANLEEIPFVKAIHFKENRKYLKYALFPIVIIGFIWFSGNLSSFFGSYERMVNYNTVYTPPAPFSFYLESNDLKILKGDSFTAVVKTMGNVQPENVFIIIDDNEYLLEQKDGFFEHFFNTPQESISFYFKANGVISRPYNLEVLAVPLIKDFGLELVYPKYISSKTEFIKSTGNASFPEGTKVKWKIKGNSINAIALILKDTSLSFSRLKNDFVYAKKVYANLDYKISTSNGNVTNFEELSYKLTVIKDANPTITVKQVLDSLAPNVAYYTGQATDDYRINSIKLVCYPSNNPTNTQVILLQSPKTNVAQFYYTFPSGLKIDKELAYSFYFEALDNDAIHGSKSIKSEVFNLNLLNDKELINKELSSQKQLLNKMDTSFDAFKKQKEALDKIAKNQKEKRNLSYTDKNEIKDFLQKQQRQENMMEKFSKQLKENLQKNNTDSKRNKLLQERLERQEIEAKKNQKLLEELDKIANKINKEELAKKLEKLAKSQKNSQRNLEQLLELTKKYYVTEKLAQLAKELDLLAKKQEVLSEVKKEDNFSKEEQEKLNEEFKELVKEIEELKKDNSNLKKPISIKSNTSKQESIAKDQEDALDELTKQQGSEESSASKSDSKSGSKASKKQKSAADKMKQMSEGMQQSSAGGGGDTITEDAEMLRQILDNLVTFSFKQEKLYRELSANQSNLTTFSRTINRQKELRSLFEHVDDSLFALSLRQVELSEFVNEQITEIFYNVDKSLEEIAENRIYQAVSKQKYTITAANKLADFLVNLLDNMNMSMKSGKGEGEGEGFQLPDIIKSQDDIQEKMNKQGKKPGEGKPGGDKKGKKPGDGKEGEGKDGKKGDKGKSGENGKDGKGGKQGANGKDGESGTDGKGGAKKGQGDGGPSSGDGLSEDELKEIYEIYKQQQTIREQLELQLLDMISNSDRDLAKKLVQQMKDFQNDLLENGITNRTRNKANNIQHQLMKLENASLRQGEKKDREATANKNRFANPITTKPEALMNFHNEIEILNRQALPLHQVFKTKVQRYFKVDD